MLPKDLLKYARKFSPAEIENAIMSAIAMIGKTLHRTPDSYDWQSLQEAVRRQAGLASLAGSGTGYTTQYTTSGTGYPTQYTTTNAVSQTWSQPTTFTNYWMEHVK